MRKLFLVFNLVLLISISSFAQVGDDGTPIRPTSNGFKMPFAPGSITTNFIGDNGFAGNTIDIDPAVDLEITALDVHEDYGAVLINIEVYYKLGTSLGYEADPNAWSYLGSGSATSAGFGNPTHIDLSGNGVIFNAGQTYGLYIFLESYVYKVQLIRYTNAGSTVYSNADLTLTTQKGLRHPLWSNPITGREWNGTIYYDTSITFPSLIADVDEIDHTTGGVVNFLLSPGGIYDTKTYLLLASFTGTSPGITLNGGANLPINWDILTNFVVAFINTPVFDQFMGTVVSGGASAVFNVGPLPPTTVGLKMDFAYAVRAKPWFGSDYVTVTIK